MPEQPVKAEPFALQPPVPVPKPVQQRFVVKQQPGLPERQEPQGPQAQIDRKRMGPVLWRQAGPPGLVLIVRRLQELYPEPSLARPKPEPLGPIRVLASSGPVAWSSVAMPAVALLRPD